MLDCRHENGLYCFFVHIPATVNPDVTYFQNGCAVVSESFVQQ
jgi:hypothetical protein